MAQHSIAVYCIPKFVVPSALSSLQLEGDVQSLPHDRSPTCHPLQSIGSVGVFVGESEGMAEGAKEGVPVGLLEVGLAVGFIVGLLVRQVSS